MARPIEPTPILYGEDAKNFLEKINEPPRPEVVAFVKEALETFKDFDPFMEAPDKTRANQKKQE